MTRPRAPRWRNRLVAFLTGLIVATSSLPISPADADHYNTTYESHIQWNMCGNVCHGGSVGPADALAASVEARSARYPHALSVNEMCESQRNRLQARLTDDGYTSFFFPTITVGGPCGRFGNAIFWRGGNGGTSYRVFTAQTASAEKRNMVCATSLSPALTACSTHLVHNNTSIAQQQSDQARGDVQAANDTGVVAYIGGDFNLTPSNAAMQRWLTDFFEADRAYASCCRLTTDGGKKIDYIYVPKASMRISHDAYIYNSSWSDHHLYQAFI